LRGEVKKKTRYPSGISQETIGKHGMGLTLKKIGILCIKYLLRPERIEEVAFSTMCVHAGG
jgi:hypothetical protein